MIMRQSLFCCHALACIASLFFVVETAAANEQSQHVTLCQPQFAHEGEAIRVTGPNSILLHDGSEVVLAGILMPTALDLPVRTIEWKAEQNAASALAQLVVGQTLKYATVRKRRDRYGRQHVHAFLETAERRRWIQSVMVELGHARVAAENLSNACARELLKREEEARSQRLGLWRNAGYGVRSANKPWHLLRYRGSYQIVEGIVSEVTQLRSKIFINFGKNKHKDFTAGIFGRLAKTARINGQTLDSLRNKRIRISGWISWRGGPFIRVRKIAQISLGEAAS